MDTLQGSKTYILAVLLMALFGLICCASSAQADWTISTIDSEGIVGMYNSIAIDSNNKVHISYLKGANLGYATNASGDWVTSTIDSSSAAGYYSSIAIDSNNKVHISYQKGIDYDNKDLKYATNASGSWVTSTIFDVYKSAYNTSITIDSNNEVHISHAYTGTFGTIYKLIYTTNESGSWVTSTIDSNSLYDVGYYSSIAIDSNNKVHISYDHDSDGLKYATNASGDWVTSTIDSYSGAGDYNSIAIDSNNKIHIIYMHGGFLYYATNASGDWEITSQQFDDTYSSAYNPSIAIDSNNKVHISYYDGNTDDLKYATNASGDWVTSTIDSEGNVGYYNSIAIDSNDKVHISYYDDTNDDLKYATNACAPLGDAPTLSSPSDDETDVSGTPALSWSDVTGATSYTVQVCGDSNCANIIATADVASSPWTVSPALNPITQYWWRVNASDSCGTGPWSDIWSFTTSLVTYNLNVNINPSGGGTVAGDGISCPGTCSNLYSEGTQVTLTASANDDYAFSAWSGCNVATESTCYVTMNNNMTVTANFTSTAYSPVYLFWSDVLGHFFTIYESEKDYIIANWSDVWQYIGISFYAYTTQVPETSPVYLFWSDILGHFFTIYESEKDYIMANWSDVWQYIGISFYAYTTQVPGTSPVYLFWSDVLGHFFTIYESEKDYIMANWSDVWEYIGISFYAYP